MENQPKLSTQSGRFTEVISSDGDTEMARPRQAPSTEISPTSEPTGSKLTLLNSKGKSSSERKENQEEEQDDDDEEEKEEHTWLAAIYPLSHFIGFRPLSHPHTEKESRLDHRSPRFNRFHYLCGRILSFGLPVAGSTGEVARFRDPETGELYLVEMYKAQVGAKVTNAIHSLIGAWVLIAVLSLMSRSPFFRAHDAPLLIGAFATEAVVTFFSYRIALAQPKNIFFGNTISAAIGIAMSHAFKHTSYGVDKIYGDSWAAASTTVATSIFAMQMLGCLHPPGAAVALLAITDAKTQGLNWYLIHVVIFSSLFVIAWALIINNLGGRRWPENWFYQNAFREPPIIGPEKTPIANAPYQLPRRRQKGNKAQEQTSNKESSEQEEKQESNNEPSAKTETGFYRVPESGTKTTVDAPQLTAGTGAVAVPTQKAKTLSRANSTDSFTTARPTETETPVKSRMIETDVSRSNSKGSKKSKRSVIVHYNEPRSSTSKPSSDIPPVPAIQWRPSVP